MFPRFVTQYVHSSCIVGTTEPDDMNRYGIIYAEGKAPSCWSSIGLPNDKINYPGRAPFYFAAPEGNELEWDLPKPYMWPVIANSAISGDSAGDDIGGFCRFLMYLCDYRSYVYGIFRLSGNPLFRHTRHVVSGCRYVDVQLRFKSNDFAKQFFYDESGPLRRKFDLIVPREFEITRLSSILDDIEEHHRGRYPSGIVVVAGRAENWS